MTNGTQQAFRYDPCWLNQVQQFCGNLTVPAWSIYVGLLAAQGITAHIAAWQTGFLPTGGFNLQLAFCGIWNVELLLFSHYLDVVARDALLKYRPMLKDLNEEEFQRINYEFTIMPHRPVLWLSIGGLAMGVFLAHTARPYQPAMFAWPWFAYVSWGFTWSVFGVFCFRVFRQLRLVSRIYGSTEKIDLYYLKPVYSLSRLALWTSLSVVIIMDLNTVIFVPQLLASRTFDIVSVSAILLALATFLTPLYGIKRRIADTKDQLMASTAREIESAYNLLTEAIGSGDSKKLSDVKAILDLVHRKKEFVHSIPIWPWNPGTFTALLSALLLPSILGILSRVFQRILGI